MRIKNILILLFAFLLIPLSINAQDADKETKAVFDSILKYFAEGRCYSELDQKDIKKCIDYYGREDFSCFFRVRDFLHDNKETYQLNHDFGIYSLEGLSSSAFSEYFLVIACGEAKLYSSGDPRLMRHVQHLRKQNLDIIDDKTIIKLLQHKVYPYGHKEYLHTQPHITHLDSLGICQPIIFKSTNDIDTLTNNVYDSILKYFVNGCCQNIYEQKLITQDIQYIGDDFTDIFWIFDKIYGSTRYQIINKELGIYDIISKLHDDFPQYTLVSFRNTYTLFRTSDVRLLQHMTMLREKYSADIPDKLLVCYLKQKVIGDDEFEYYQSYKNPSKKRIGKIEYIQK